MSFDPLQRVVVCSDLPMIIELKVGQVSSLQHNIPLYFCLVLVFWNLLRMILLCICDVIVIMKKVLFCSETCVRDESILCQSKNKSKRRNFSSYFDDVTKKKEKAVLISSRIRERDKKNAEYYVGDYSKERGSLSSRPTSQTQSLPSTSTSPTHLQRSVKHSQPPGRDSGNNFLFPFPFLKISSF